MELWAFGFKTFHNDTVKCDSCGKAIIVFSKCDVIIEHLDYHCGCGATGKVTKIMYKAKEDQEGGKR